MTTLLSLLLAAALAAPAPPELCPATEKEAEKLVSGLNIKAPVLPLGDTPTPYLYDGGGLPVWGDVPEGYGIVKSKQAFFALIRILPVREGFDYARALQEGLPGNIAPECSGPTQCRWTAPAPRPKGLRSVALTPSQGKLLLSCYYADPPKRGG